jgi:hypothetical protein
VSCVEIAWSRLAVLPGVLAYNAIEVNLDRIWAVAPRELPDLNLRLASMLDLATPTCASVDVNYHGCYKGHPGCKGAISLSWGG